MHLTPPPFFGVNLDCITIDKTSRNFVFNFVIMHINYPKTLI